MTPIIRRATVSDCKQMVEIYRPSIEQSNASFELKTPSVDEFAARVQNSLLRHEWLVAELEDLVIGYAYGTTHRSRAAYRFSVETSVYVHKNFQGQGMGKELYRSLLTRLAHMDFHNAYAGITLPNPSSVAIHESLGFKAIGIFREIGFKNDHWHDVGWWQCSLDRYH